MRICSRFVRRKPLYLYDGFEEFFSIFHNRKSFEWGNITKVSTYYPSDEIEVDVLINSLKAVFQFKHIVAKRSVFPCVHVISSG